MRMYTAPSKKEEKKEVKKTILTVEEDVKIPGTKIILEKGDKIEVMASKELEEQMSVTASVSYPGADGSFTVDKVMDTVMPEDEEGEPEEIEVCYLNGNLNFNINCGDTMPDTASIEEAVKAFVNKFASEKV